MRLVLFATGDIDGVKDTDLAEVLNFLRWIGVEIITVGLGKGVSRGWLEALAATPGKALSVSNLLPAGLQTTADLIAGLTCEEGELALPNHTATFYYSLREPPFH